MIESHRGCQGELFCHVKVVVLPPRLDPDLVGKRLLDRPVVLAAVQPVQLELPLVDAALPRAKVKVKVRERFLSNYC